jgi:gamma-glutamyltranspeptidase/glutathione hydrolase
MRFNKNSLHACIALRFAQLACAALLLQFLPVAGAIAGMPAAAQAAVAAPDEFGAHAAMDVIKAGGNAVDAAVATAFVLAVTYPRPAISAAVAMVIYLHGKPAFLDYRETAPAAATRDMYLDEKGAVIKDASVIGPRAAASRVPWPGCGRRTNATARGHGANCAARHPLGARWLRPSSPWRAASRRRAAVIGHHQLDQYFGKVQAGTVFRQPEPPRR